MTNYVMPFECKPNREYVIWYRSITIDYLSEHRLLVGPHEQASSPNLQHIKQQVYTHNPAQQS